MITIEKIKDIKNKRYYIIGIVLALFNYMRRSLLSFRFSNTITADQFERKINYDFEVVENWLRHLRHYSNEAEPLRGKVVLELGPGRDLGIGLILLAMGAKKYIALDVFDRVKNTPAEFYSKLLDRLKDNTHYDIDYLKDQLEKYRSNGRISYIVDRDFKIGDIKDKIDIVFSHTAFEHFDNVENTMNEINNITTENAFLISRVDLQTHTSWIRGRDPLNIYRYSDFFWDALKFKGAPNRVRTPYYKRFLEANNWHVTIEPVRILEEEYVKKVKPSLNEKFMKYDDSEMQILGFFIMARKQ